MQDLLPATRETGSEASPRIGHWEATGGDRDPVGHRSGPGDLSLRPPPELLPWNPAEDCRQATQSNQAAIHSQMALTAPGAGV